MTTDEQRNMAAYAAKVAIIESEIELRIEAVGGHVSDERKVGLRRMTKPDLQKLVQELQAATSAQAAISMIVKGICASDAARCAEEDRKYDGLGGPVNIDL